MDTDPKKPDEDEDASEPILPEIEDGGTPAKTIEEKGEPFDGNLA